MAATLRRIETVANQLHYSTLAAKNDYDVIVVGGGINGTSTAYALAKRNKKVLLLEQFDVNHEEGSSHGDGRIIRYSYPEAVYIELAKLVYPLWKEVEAIANTKLTHISGGILFGPPDHPDTISLMDNLKKCGIPFEILSIPETKKRFPMFNIPEGNIVVYQKESGVAFASKAVKALWDASISHGATIMPREKVISLQVVNEHQVAVKTQNGKRFTASKLVVAAGAWAQDLLLQLNLKLKLKITEEEVFYWKDKREGNNEHSMHNMPIFIVHDEPQFYGLPQIDIPGVKIGWHHSGTELDINSKKHLAASKEREKVVSKFVQKVFPNLAHEAPSHKLLCLYTTTEDGHFILDRHPEYKNVVVVSACSGHGFKFGPIVGDLAALLALGESIPLNIDEFRLSRFGVGPLVKRSGV